MISRIYIYMMQHDTEWYLASLFSHGRGTEDMCCAATGHKKATNGVTILRPQNGPATLRVLINSTCGWCCGNLISQRLPLGVNKRAECNSGVMQHVAQVVIFSFATDSVLPSYWVYETKIHFFTNECNDRRLKESKFYDLNFIWKRYSDIWPTNLSN